MDPPFLTRAVRVDGLCGHISNEYYNVDGSFKSAMVVFDDASAMPRAITSFEALKKALVPLADPLLFKVEITSEEEEASVGETAVSSVPPGRSEEGEEDATTQTEEAEQELGQKSAVKQIALPLYGNSDEHYVMGPTGVWYSKSLAKNPDDESLLSWIDRDFDPKAVWHIQSIVDDRKRSTGAMEYLVKFPGYELNPGVKDEESNYGDWYTTSQRLDKQKLKEYQERKAKRSAKSFLVYD